MTRSPQIMASISTQWQALRDHAALHRGLWTVAPIFWASFAVFLHPVYGTAGFLLHAIACLPRGRIGRCILLASFPLLALWFADRAPFLTLPEVPLHRTYAADAADAAPSVRTGIVAGIPAPSPLGWTFPFRETGGSGLLYRATTAADSTGLPPQWGASLRLHGRAEPPSPALNPGQLDMRRVLCSQGTVALLRATAWEQVRPPPAWKARLTAARAYLNARLERHVPRAALPLLEAALLNNTTRVPAETRDAFFRSGMQHILAISGQHIGLLIAFLLILSRCVRLPRKTAFLIAGLLTAAYVPLVGAPVSVVRSGIMLACLMPAILLERPGAGLHALCLTASADLLFDAHNILNLGFQLSYAATLALLLGSRPAQTCATRILGHLRREGSTGNTWIAGALQMVLLSALIALFTYPVLAASTHATTPWGILGNVVTVPIGAAMLIGGLITLSLDLPGLAGLLPPLYTDTLAACAGAATGLCALLLEGCVFFLADLPGALRPIAHPSAGWLATLAAGCGLTTLLLRREHFLPAALCAALCLAGESLRAATSGPGPGEARITFLAVGHGDAAVLELPGAVLLIDAGNSPRVTRNVILPFLQYRGIARLDAVLLTHPDHDHYGGASALLDRIPVGFFLGPPEPGEPSISWRCLRNRIRERGTPWKEGRAGQRVYAGHGFSLWMLGPDSTLSRADKNDRSLVALLHTPRESALLTGDIEHSGQRALAASWPLWRGAWLKAPHHGSDRTTLSCFLRAAAPPRAVVSCGGRRGFPGARTLDTLAALGTDAAVTARHGAVTWEFGRGKARARIFRPI